MCIAQAPVHVCAAVQTLIHNSIVASLSAQSQYIHRTLEHTVYVYI